MLYLGPSSQLDFGHLISEALDYGVISLGMEIIFVLPVVLLFLLSSGLALVNQGMKEFFNSQLSSSG